MKSEVQNQESKIKEGRSNSKEPEQTKLETQNQESKIKEGRSNSKELEQIK